jgi:hypothetical protein
MSVNRPADLLSWKRALASSKEFVRPIDCCLHRVCWRQELRAAAVQNALVMRRLTDTNLRRNAYLVFLFLF